MRAAYKAWLVASWLVGAAACGDGQLTAPATSSTSGSGGHHAGGAPVSSTSGSGGVGAGGPCPLPPPPDSPYRVGAPVLGQNGYIEYVPGNLPIIISAPHGGTLEPADLPPDDGLARDGGSRETALLVYDELRRLTGRTPHLVVNHIMRNRLNLNREDASPNADVPTAVVAWNEFHRFIDDAKAWVTSACGRGHFFDFHTNGHAAGWVEMGVALSASTLAFPDAMLEVEGSSSTYRALASQPEVSFVEVIRGGTSLGGLLEAEGILATPSPLNPSPPADQYFNGGFNVRAHGSRDGGVIDGTQLEMHFSYINSGEENREVFARTLTAVLIAFMERHYGFDLDAP